MTLSVDLFFSFRSPYSYLALPKTLKLVADHDATVNLRPVYPLAVRVPGFFKRANPQFARYVVLDSSRVAKHENIPFRFPRPGPIVQNMATLDVAEHQPYIHRLTRLGATAQVEGRSLGFVDAISRVLWNGTVNGWNEGDHLARAVAAAGFDLADGKQGADPPRLMLTARHDSRTKTACKNERARTDEATSWQMKPQRSPSMSRT
jgi:2-hydroxychromene-2-carboxylate isomerase